MSNQESTEHLPEVSVVDQSAAIGQNSLMPDRIGPYKIRKRLGAGGMGVVYLAEQENPQRLVALKVIQPERTSPKLLRRFEYETRVLGRLQHPGIGQIFEAGAFDTQFGPQPYFAMEYVKGKELVQFADDNQLELNQRLNLIVSVCEAVQHAHQRGIIHRDLKPGNILVDENGQPKILDFGVARLMNADVEVSKTVTEAGQLVGTVQYMSPEQAGADSDEIDIRSDVYTLGVICYKLLTGKLPYELTKKTVPAAVRVIQENTPAPLGANGAFPKDLETILTKVLEKEKGRRYQTAADFSADIRNYLNDLPIAARPHRMLYRLRKFAKRRKPVVIGIATTLLALLLGVIGIIWFAIDAQNSARAAKLAKQDADRKANEANDAQKETKKLLTASYAQSAKLAMERGAWHQVLSNSQMALDAGYKEPVQMYLNRARAWQALNEPKKAIAEIQKMRALGDLGKHKGTVLLWEAYLNYGRSTDVKKPLKQMEAALQEGLTKADQSFARGLLASNTEDGIKHLKDALREDPFHQEAYCMLGSVLVSLGRLQQARELALPAEKLFPKDARFKFLRALVLASEKKLDEANEVMKQAEGEWSDEQIKGAKLILDVFHFLRDFDGVSVEPFKMIVFTNKITKAANQFFDKNKIKQPDKNANAVNIFHPILAAFGYRLFNMLEDPKHKNKPPLLKIRLMSGKLLEHMAEFSKSHPDSLYLFTRAMLMRSKGQTAEAQDILVQASKASSITSVQRTAKSMKIATDWLLARDGKLKPEKAKQIKQQSLRELRQLYPFDKLPPYIHRGFVEMAMQSNEFDLARVILNQWEREQPSDGGPKIFRLKLNFLAGAYWSVIEGAKKMPENKEAQTYSKMALEQIGKRRAKLFSHKSASPGILQIGKLKKQKNNRHQP